MTASTASRRLTRARRDKMIGGVCAGIAEFFHVTPALVRVLFVLSCLLPGPQFLIYLAMWIFVPESEA
ncbi:PspC domain-containing protein [Rhodococcus spelaei]|uniref:PspC domain-containing protein n=1 Tax=Rhodococcus spelaei TaxID=2546320 RepID=A0A541B0P9_9NOCA|nr:PspC domain-containing protein [Rhodococcus spelaei]TQF65894.1 PspC domain-containing protein [Rhodococcus spelaei]